MSERPPINTFDSLIEEMRLKGFTFYKLDSLYETLGQGVKNNPDHEFKFVTKQIQTKEELINKNKNLPEFAEVKDSMEVELIELLQVTKLVYRKATTFLSE